MNIGETQIDKGQNEVWVNLCKDTANAIIATPTEQAYNLLFRVNDVGRRIKVSAYQAISKKWK